MFLPIKLVLTSNGVGEKFVKSVQVFNLLHIYICYDRRRITFIPLTSLECLCFVQFQSVNNE